MEDLGQFQRYLIEEFVEDWREGHMSRRDMVKRTVYITGAAAATKPAGAAGAASPAAGATGAASPAVGATGAAGAAAPPARSPLSVKADDPAIEAKKVEFPGEAGTVLGYLARPKAAGTYA